MIAFCTEPGIIRSRQILPRKIKSTHTPWNYIFNATHISVILAQVSHLKAYASSVRAETLLMLISLADNTSIGLTY